jgi:phosphoglycerate-specific signal transduction histidine kinase
VDLPQDGSDSTFDGRDGKVDESDRFSARNTLQHTPSAASEGPPPPNDDNALVLTNLGISIMMHHKNEQCLYKIEERVIRLYNNQHQYFDDINSKMDNLLQEMEWYTSAIGDEIESAFQIVFDKLDNLTRQVDKMALEEVALYKAYCQSTAETAALKATINTLIKQVNEHII